jgi:hypothetical protein
MRILVCLLPLAVMLHAQQAAKPIARKPKPALAPEVQKLVDLARAAPPEIYADALITLVADGVIPRGEIQAKLLEDAFSAAGHAQEPMRLKPLPGLGPDTRALLRGKAADLGLDALSLENRALQSLVQIDPARARQLFAGIAQPTLEPSACSDALVPDDSAYYEMAAAVAQYGFRADEKKREQNVQFLVTALEGAHLPGEIAAFAQSLAGVSLKRPELDLVLASLAAKMGQIAPDYRTFTMTAYGFEGALVQLFTRARSAGVNAEAIPPALRHYLIEQMTAPRCDQDFGDGQTIVDWFNQQFHGALAPITAEEIQPSKREPGFKADSYFDSEDGKTMSQEFDRLRNALGGRPGSASETSGDEWRSMLADLLREFATWTPSGSDIDVFDQKMTVLRGLFQITPPGEDRDQVLGLCVAYLESSGAERQHPAEWMFQVNSLTGLAGADQRKLLDAFRSSGDAGLAVYAALHPAR